jgi:hypothetical protein
VVFTSNVFGLMNGTATPSQVGWALVASIVLLAVFAPLNMRLDRRKH